MKRKLLCRYVHFYRNDWEERRNKLVLQTTTRHATPSGVGGDAGCGGWGGLPGKFFIVALKDSAKMPLFNSPGTDLGKN